MKKRIYRWHRQTSLLIALPLLLWAASGILHPIMTNMRPQVASQRLSPKPVDSNAIHTSLQQALQQNQLDSFTNIRLVCIDTNWFYQVQQGRHKDVTYLSTATGKLLKDGDVLYAKYLAKLFLENNKDSTGTQTVATELHDCCDAATAFVTGDTRGAKIGHTTRITAFDEEYKTVNRILPVYRVEFERADGIRIYVEPTQDRFVVAVDNKRAFLGRLFTLFHTWGWLSFLGKGRILVEIVLSLLLLFVTASGIYIFCITRSKPTKGNPVLRARKHHRITSISFVLFTFMFTFSGLYHLIQRLPEDTRHKYYDEHWFRVSQTGLNLQDIISVVKKPVTNISLVHMKGESYWQVQTLLGKNKKEGRSKHNHPMQNQQAVPSATIYVSVTDKQLLPNGETAYACYLATLFSGHVEKDIENIETITKFAGEYGFANKRLPVHRITYGNKHNERLYVETSTGTLAARINDLDMVESYSFAFLHKHEFLAGIGKMAKDLSTMIWSIAQIALVIVALLLYTRIRKKVITKT